MLIRIGVDGPDVRFIRNQYWKQEETVKDETSGWQKIERGVRQWCVVSPDLFNQYSEIIMRDISHLKGVSVAGRNLNGTMLLVEKSIPKTSDSINRSK